MKTAWQYARHEKKQYLGVYSLFILASVVVAMNPLLYGWFINALQKNGLGMIRYAWIYGFAFLGLKLMEWGFHGPARIIERRLAFNLSRNFLQELYHQTLHLPVKWHQDHHSGATINRIRKAYEALKEFFQNWIFIPLRHHQIFFLIHSYAFLLSFIWWDRRFIRCSYRMGDF
ncbi:MAG: hypothetical protein WDM78_01100 [Puia sp.]